MHGNKTRCEIVARVNYFYARGFDSRAKEHTLNPNTFPFGSDLEIHPLSILLFLAVDMQGRKCSGSGSGGRHCLEEQAPQDKQAWLGLQRPRLGSCETVRPSWPASGAEFLASLPIGHGE